MKSQISLADEAEIRLSRVIIVENYKLLRDVFRHYGCFSSVPSDEIILDNKAVNQLLSEYDIIEGEFDERKVDEILTRIFDS